MNNICAKEQAIDMIKGLPKTSDWGDIFYELYVRHKINKGIKDIKRGHLVSQEKVEKMFLSEK